MASPAYKVVQDFEETIAKWAGSKYAVAVESCTAAMFLSLQYKGIRGKTVKIPRFTYPSVAATVWHCGGKIVFDNEPWEGVYELGDTGVIDSALRFQPGMYRGGFHCLSFHSKKLLPIGRGGMILLDDYEAYKWLKKARFDGRDEVPLGEDKLDVVGWNMYMMPEQAARGLQLFDMVKTKIMDDLDARKQDYPDLAKAGIYQDYI